MVNLMDVSSGRCRQPAGSLTSPQELGLGSLAVLRLVSQGKEGRGPSGFRATCPTPLGFSSRLFGKGEV